jgi:hypothetical protein
MDRKAVGDAVQDVADDRAGRRGNDADHMRQEGQGLLAFCVEEPFGGELAATFLQERHQRAGAGRLQHLDDDLVFRGAGEGGDLAGGDHLHALFRLEAQAGEAALPDDGVNARLVVFQREIGVPRGMRAAIAGNLAAHAYLVERLFDRALDGAGKLRNRIFGKV